MTDIETEPTPVPSPAEVVPDETLDVARQAIASGVFSVEEAAKTWHLTDAEVAQLGGPKAPSKLSVQQELDAIDRLRKENPKKYWSNEVQAREEELIGLQLKAKDDRSQPSPETADRLSAISKELADIDKARSESRRSYDQSAQDRELELLREKERLELGTDGLSKELLEEWSETGGVEHNLTNARTAATGILDELDETEQTTLAQGFDELPQPARDKLIGFLAVDPSDRWREADAADVERFKNEAVEQAELVSEWGPQAPKKLGAILGRVRALHRSMSPADADAAMVWYQSLSATQSKAVLRHLAGKR
jgi:hypothetical protein